MMIERALPLLAAAGLSLLAACTTPAPPRPAMQPLSVAGNFGFSDRNIDGDTVEITYRGAEVKLSGSNPRGDARISSEKDKVHDLALLRAARIAQERGAAAFRIVSEKTDSDIDVQSYPHCNAAPFWGPGYGYYGRRHAYGYGYGGYGWPYYGYPCSERRWASGRAVSVLTVDLVARPVAGDQSLGTADTIAKLEKIYANATYP
jgi:hypothetical protein